MKTKATEILQRRINRTLTREYLLLFIGIVAALLISVILFSCAPEPKEVEAPLARSKQEMILRGKYLTTIGGCND